MARITYVPNRVIDANGVSAGATITVTLDGTTTLAPIYYDAELLERAPNPFEVNAGAEVPPLYHSGLSGDIRVRVVTADGTVTSDDNPYTALANSDDIAEVQSGITSEAVSRATADGALSTRIDSLEATTVSGIRVYTTWADAEAAFEDYDNLAAYVVDNTVLDQSAWWICIQAGTGNAPPTLPVTSNAYWTLLSQTPGGSIAQVGSTDSGTHTDPVVGGTVDNSGVFRWSSDPVGWERIDDLDSQVAKTHADAAAASSAILGGSATQGMFPTKPDDEDGNIQWISRTEMGQQALSATDLTDTDQYQLHGTFSSPETRFTATIVGDELELDAITNNIFPVGPVTGALFRTGSSYEVRGRVTAGTGASAAGIALVMQPTEPTLGGAVTNFTSGACVLVARSNGTFQVLDYLATTEFPGAVSSNPNLSSTYTDEEIVIIMEMTSTTEANINIKIGGKAQLPRTVTGLPANCYFGGAIRFASSSTTGMLSDLIVDGESLDVAKRIYINPSGSSGAAGTRISPFNSLSEASATIDRDTSRRTLNILLKGGVLRDTIRIDATGYEEVTIRGVTGTRPLIMASVAVATSWTNIAGSEVWYTDKPLYLDNNVNYGALVDVTADVVQTFGRTDSYSVTGTSIYGRATQNLAYNDATFVRGVMSVHTTDTYAGKVLVRMHDGGDPNDSDWEFTRYDYGISIVSGDDAGWNGCRVNIEGVDVWGSFLGGINLRRVRYHLEDILSSGNTFYGFQLDQSSGQGYGLRAESNVGDGFNWVGNTPDSDRLLRSQLFDCWAKGMGYFNDIGFWGDGFSNHKADQHAIYLDGCGSIGAGKSGLASAGSFDLHNFVARDSWSSGVEIYGEVGYPSTSGTITGGELSTNLYGIYCHTDAATDLTRAITADRVRMNANAQSHYYAVAQGSGSSATIDVKDGLHLGDTPVEGNVKLSGDGAAVNFETSDPAGA